MLNSAVIDVGIAIVYVFVLVSILVSALNEILAGLLKQRAKALWHGIGDLLKSDALRDEFYRHGLIRSLGPPVSVAQLTPERMAGPSYIPKETFVVTMLDVLKQSQARIVEVESTLSEAGKALRAGAPPSAALAKTLESLAKQLPGSTTGTAIRDKLTKLAEATTQARATAAQVLPLIEALRQSLPAGASAGIESVAASYSKEFGTVVRLLAEEAAGDIDRFRKALEAWFDEGMDRVSGWYKRWTQVWQLGIGLVLAVLLNINVLAIGQRLWDDIPLRTAIVAEAEKFAKDPPAGLPVKGPAKAEGDFELRVMAVGLSQNDKRILGNVRLREPATENTTVAIKAPDVTFEKASVTIPKGSNEAEFTGTAKAFPLKTTFEASATAGPEGKTTTKTAKLPVTLDATPATQIDRTRDYLTKTRLPIGWPDGFPFTASFDPGKFDWTQIPGWLLTAIGASFGAPFWFDLLNHFVKLRSGGPKPDESKPAAKAAGQTQTSTA